MPAIDASVAAALPPSWGRQLWRSLRASRGAMTGLGLCVTLLALAVGAGVLAPHSPIQQWHDAILRPPAWMDGGSWRFPLGTDMVGRDLLARLLHGARLSLLIGLLVVGVSNTVGVTFGLLAGYHRGWIEQLTMRVVDVLLAIPSLLLAIAVVAILGPSLNNAILAIAIVNIPGVIRLTRAAVLTQAGRDYVTASRMAGASNLRLMLTAVLPNCLAPLIVQATLGYSAAVLDAAALGFLGLGAQPPTPEWGTMLSDSMQFMQSAWWVVTFPGIAVLLTVLGFNLLGDGLRDALDPRLAGRI